jgi:enamine deaminase RidA (YjgF/YER057c/UK114 family)
MSVEYDGVAIFGRARVLADGAERERGLRLILDKYFPHLEYGVAYRAITPDELARTSVYRIEIDSWSGKRKRVDDDFAGAFRYGAHPAQLGEPRMAAADHTSAEQRIIELGLEMPQYRAPAGTFVHAVRTGNLMMLSGHAPIRADGSVIFGRLGETLDVDAGYGAARVAAIGALATLRHELGSLDRVVRIVRMYGVVNATPEFLQHTQVINGASDLLVEVFGEAGKHARLAVGVSSLPFNIALEVELTVELAD